MFKIELGVKVRDRITGFEGLTTGRVEYITGCNQYTVQPQVKKEGEFVESRWFDEHRLSLVGRNAPIVLDDAKKNGADTPAPIK